MRHQIYGDKLAQLLDDLNEEGLSYVVEEYTLEDLQEIRKREKNEHGQYQLDKIIERWTKVREVYYLLFQELEDVWDREEYYDRVNAPGPNVDDSELGEEENTDEYDQPNSPFQKPFMLSNDDWDGYLDDYDNCTPLPDDEEEDAAEN